MTTPAALDILRLAGPDVELLIDLADGYPVILHWGSPVGAMAPDQLRVLLSKPAPHSDVDEFADPGVLRESARAFVGRPALIGHRAGKDFSPLFTVVSHEQTPRHISVELRDQTAHLSVSLRWTMTAQGVILVDASVTNEGEGDYTVDSFDIWMPVPDRATQTLDFSGRWLRERQPQRLPFAPGLRQRETKEGRSGHDHTIVQCALEDTATTERGEVWALGLRWSGNCRHLAERSTHGRNALGAGELLEPGEVILEKGKTYLAPTVVALYSREGLDGMGSRSHEWLRAREIHPGSLRPLTLNVWEAVYFDHNLATLSALAERAAAAGVERFVLDDGWFGSRRNDHSGLGDWAVSAEVWPDGLAPLSELVKRLGMQFGLWFEGEMVNPDSDLYRAHPDWVLGVGDRVAPLARHQLVLDLTNGDAFSHVLESVNAVINAAGVDYIKWDHNRSLVDPGHQGRAAVSAQTHAIYRMFDELKRRNPGLEIESCASGGGRIDLGMVEHVDRFWTSDQNDALERQEIQRWTSLVIPPEMLGTHIGPTVSHGTGRLHSIQFRAITALFGHAGLEWNLLEATPEELSAVTLWAAFYKEWRGLLHTGRVVRVEHPDPSATVHGVVAHDKSAALFSYAQCQTLAGSTPMAFRLPHLQPDALYRVKAQDFGGAHTVQRSAPRWLTGVTATGAALATVGLRPPILWPAEAVLAVVTRVDGPSVEQ